MKINDFREREDSQKRAMEKQLADKELEKILSLSYMVISKNKSKAIVNMTSHTSIIT